MGNRVYVINLGNRIETPSHQADAVFSVDWLFCVVRNPRPVMPHRAFLLFDEIFLFCLSVLISKWLCFGKGMGGGNRNMNKSVVKNLFIKRVFLLLCLC